MLAVMVVALSATVTVTTSLAGAQPTPGGPGFATVLIANVSGDAAQFSIDGAEPATLAYGAVAPPRRVVAGSHQVGVGSGADAQLTVSSGCQHLWLLRPANSRPTVMDIADCPPPRPTPGHGVVRLINAAPNAGAVTLAARAAKTGSALPWSASARLDVPADDGLPLVVSRAGSSGVIRETTATVRPNSALSAVLAGGGEIPVVLFLVDEGDSGFDPPADIPINTGRPPSRGRASLLLPVMALGLVALGGAVLRRRAAGAMSLAAALLLSTVSCTEFPGGTAPSASADSPSLPGPPPTTPPPGSPAPTTPSPRAVPAIPAHVDVGPISTRVVTLRADQATVLWKVLPDPDAAYLEGSAMPGRPGIAVIAAHSQWGNAAGVFAPLANLPADTPVTLTSHDGAVTRWRIEQIIEAPKSRLPSWLWAPNAVPLLALVTCSGPIDPSTGLHANSLVAVASPA